MKNTKMALIALVAIVTIGSSACKRKGCIDDKATNYESKAKKDDGSCEYPNADLVLEMNHMVNGEGVVFNNIRYTSEVGNKYSIATLKYFISDVMVHSASGDVSVDGSFYIDGTDASTLELEAGTLAPGDYTGISFTFGFTNENNTTGMFTNAPESNMEWPEMNGGGYHYMKFEGQYDSLNTGNIKAFNTHLGRTAMMGMNHDNSFSVSIDEAFTIMGETEAHINVGVELDNWFESPNTYDFNDYDNGIMMNQSAQDVLKENGSTDVFSILEVHLH